MIYRSLILTIIFLFVLVYIDADSTNAKNFNDHYQEGLQDAQELSGSIPKPNGASLAENIPQSSEFEQKVGDGSIRDPRTIAAQNLVQDASTEASTDENSHFVGRSFDEKDKYAAFVDEKFVQNASTIVDNPTEVLKSLQVGEGCNEKETKPEGIDLKTASYSRKKPDVATDISTCEASGEKLFKCEKSLKLTCIKDAQCDNGGIVPGSVESDMKWEYNFPTLTIGTIANNYWPGNCTVYDRTIKFLLKNLDKIKEFKISQVGYDDYLWIKINGHTVYVGPYGGDRIELTEGQILFWKSTVVTNGQNHHSCELGTDWKFDVNLDLKPYLKEGQNEIWMRVIVSGYGEGWMKIDAKQHCCKEWKETWSDECEKELKAST